MLTDFANSISVIENITELVTHKHDDHFKTAVAELALQGGRFQRIVVPNPKLEASRNDIFNLLNEHNVNTNVNKQLLDITTPNGTPLDLEFTTIGDFVHSKFNVNNDVTVEVFRYQRPRQNVNHDGLIYQITHNGVTQLLFGDFDNIKAIENLLDASVANEQRRNEIDKKISNLYLQEIETENEQLLLETYFLKYLNTNNISPDIIIKVINKLQQLTRKLERIEKNIEKLQNKKGDYPVLKGDVIKWMHHAHVFSETKARDVIIKLHDVVEPQYIIWQRYNRQTEQDFKDFIEPLPFKDKCLNSGERDITVISLEYLIKQILFS